MNIRKFFLEIYWKIERVIAPTLKHSQYFYEDILTSHVNQSTTWIDLGCGHSILPTWRPQKEKHLVDKCEMIVGIDYDLHSLKNHKNILLKVRGDIGKLPFGSNFFDLVTANMVVEHLDNPDAQFREIKRVLKPNGMFIFHTPNIMGYSTIMGRLVPSIFKNKLIHIFQGRKEEDVFDTYYMANNVRAINTLARKAGFEVERIKMVNSSGQFAIIPPLVFLELVWLRILMMKRFRSLRPYIVAILRKEE